MLAPTHNQDLPQLLGQNAVQTSNGPSSPGVLHSTQPVLGSTFHVLGTVESPVKYYSHPCYR